MPMPMHSPRLTARLLVRSLVVLALAMIVLPQRIFAQQLAYFADRTSQSILIVNTANNMLQGMPIPVGINPIAIAVKGDRAYVVNTGSGDAPGTLNVINTSSASVVATINIGDAPEGVAVNPVLDRAYVPRRTLNDVVVIDTSMNTVIPTPIPVGFAPVGAAVTPDGSLLLVTNNQSNSVSYINTTTNAKFGTDVMVGTHPEGIAITNDPFDPMPRAYVANGGSQSVSVIDVVTRGILGTPLVDASARFLRPATYGDVIDIETWIDEWRSKSFVQKHRVWRGEDLLVEGTEVRVFVARGAGGSGIRGVVVPDDIRAL